MGFTVNMGNVLGRVVCVLGLCVVLGSATSLTAQEVYLCMGPKSSAYHLTPNCRGLRNCSTQLKKMSEKEAVSKGRHACRFCCR